MEEGVINRKFLRPFGSLYVPRFFFWVFAVVTLSVALPVHSDQTVWNAATEFWWNASWNDPTPENGHPAWDNAGFGGRIDQSESQWSYGLLNTTGGTVNETINDPYPTSITQTTSGPNNRGAFGQFFDSTSGADRSYYYEGIEGGGLYLYQFFGTQIGVYGSPWDEYAPGNNGLGAGRVGNPNRTHMFLNSAHSGAGGSDGFASALRWTATEAGTYRFYGEFVPGGVVPGGVPTYSQSFAILKSSPAGANNSGDRALLSRSTVGDDGPVTSYDITAILAAGDTVTWVVGSNGAETNYMGVQAQVQFLGPPILTLSGAVEFKYTGNQQEPVIVKVGSPSTITKRFVGVGSTIYDSGEPPINPGTYKVISSVASDGTYGPATLDTNFKIIGYWNAATEFWWNATTPENGSTVWASVADAGFGGRTSQSQSRWSYGLINTTGGDPVADPYPTSITGTTGGPSSPRGAFSQFFDSTSGADRSLLFIGIPGGGLYLYQFLGTQIGVYGSPWDAYAPGNDGEGADKVKTPNLTHMFLNSSFIGTPVPGSDGFASALRWTAPAAGTYRFYGEFVPGGVPGYSQSFAILKASPGANSSGDATLLSRSTVGDDGPVTGYDITATLAAGDTVTWVVGANGAETNYMGVQAQVEFLGLPQLTITAAPTASAITYGQTLADSVLSGGTASVAGAFAFTSSSTAPNAGTANQGVTFTPTDTTNYNTATTTVSVTVNPAQLTITATAASKNQGNLDPVLIYEVSGLQGSDVMTGELFRVTGEAPGTYAIQQGTLSAGGNYTISFNGALLTITGGQSFDSWSGGAPLTDDLLRKYVFGGASGPNAASEAPVYSLDGSTLSLTAIVRKNDPAIRVEGTFTTDLGNANSWSTSGVSSTTVGVDQNVPEGTERRKYSVERGSNAKKFLRLKVVTQ